MLVLSRKTYTPACKWPGKNASYTHYEPQFECGEAVILPESIACFRAGVTIFTHTAPHSLPGQPVALVLRACTTYCRTVPRP